MILTKIKKTSVDYHHYYRITCFNESQYYEDRCIVSGFILTEIINVPTVTAVTYGLDTIFEA